MEYPVFAAIYVLVMLAAIFGLLYLVYDICCATDPYPPPKAAPGAARPAAQSENSDDEDEDPDEVNDDHQEAPTQQSKKDQ